MNSRLTMLAAVIAVSLMLVSIINFAALGLAVTQPRVVDLGGDPLATRQASFSCPWLVGTSLYGTYACIGIYPLGEQDVYKRLTAKTWMVKIQEDGTIVIFKNLGWDPPKTSRELMLPEVFYFNGV